MERYVAIDNVCAWPNLTRLPDGRILAVIFNQPTHGGWEGDVECWASQDDGRVWGRCGVVAAHEAGTNRMNVAAGLTRSGEMVVLASGWSRRQPVGDYRPAHEGEVLPMWVCRSGDGGRTWTRELTPVPPPEGANCSIPYGDVVVLPGGDLGVCVYDWSPGSRNRAVFYASTDDGRTWSARGTVQAGDTNETTPVVLPDGRVLVAARTATDQHLELYESADEGATWDGLGPVTLGHQHPGHLLLLADQRVLLTYGIRNRGLYGVGTRISEDGGRTWSAPSVLVDFQAATDGGYPATVLAADGTLVTAYYCNCTPAHQRYHMGVVRWPARQESR